MATTTTTATTTTDIPPSHTIALTDNNPNTTAAFNYWGSTSTPEEKELFAIFTGTSTLLKKVHCPITDIRPQGLSATSFNLSTHGFQVLKHASALLPPQSGSIPDFHDKTLTNGTYWPELVNMLKSQLGVRSVVGIVTVVRDKKEIDSSVRGANQSMQPFFMVHGDYTPAGARAHFRAMTDTFFEENESIQGTTAEERAEFFKLRDEVVAAEDEAMREEGVDDQWKWSGKNYQGPRWGYLSVWRALETVRRDPLGVMDPRTLFRADVETPYVGLQRNYASRPGFVKNFRSENPLIVAPESGDRHTWYYISGQTPEEVYALKLFDSEAQKEGSLVTPFAAHSAFMLPETADEKPRRSVEVRVMVIW